MFFKYLLRNFVPFLNKCKTEWQDKKETETKKKKKWKFNKRINYIKISQQVKVVRKNKHWTEFFFSNFQVTKCRKIYCFGFFENEKKVMKLEKMKDNMVKPLVTRRIVLGRLN